MKPMDFWKNFRLGEELSVSGAFIYNGLRRFYELRKLDHADEIFEVYYYLSIGLERLMKIAIVLLEHEDTADQTAFERSLITHSHQDLLARIKKRVKVNLSGPHNDFLSLLTTFYKTLRYDRFSLQSPASLGKERHALFDFLEKHLRAEFEDRDSVFGHENDARYKKFLRQIVIKISGTLYEIVKERARELNLYTYELRSGSKAETVFLGEADMHGEDTLWKELLIFFMNTKETSGYLKFLRGIEPLNFDPGLVDDYLRCFQSDSAKSEVIDELETLYEDLPDKKERLEMMAVIGANNVFFNDEEVEDDCEDDQDK